MAQPFKLFAYTPSCFPEPSIAISASMNTNGVGVLDLEYMRDMHSKSVLDALIALSQHAKKDYGIKLSGHALIAEKIAKLTLDLPRKPNYITFSHPTTLDAKISIFKEQIQILHNQYEFFS